MDNLLHLMKWIGVPVLIITLFSGRGAETLLIAAAVSIGYLAAVWLFFPDNPEPA